MRRNVLHLRERIFHYVKRYPGSTELEISKAIYGERILASKINSTWRDLIEKGILTRQGNGIRNNPYRYYVQ